jgi:hypothetical protein
VTAHDEQANHSESRDKGEENDPNAKTPIEKFNDLTRSLLNIASYGIAERAKTLS